jgi:hypothetical protein
VTAGSSNQLAKSKKLDLGGDDEVVEVKKENIDPDEALHDIELLSLLDMSTTKQQQPDVAMSTETAAAAAVDDFQAHVKTEPTDDIKPAIASANLDASTLDVDLQRQIDLQTSSNKFLFYWFDLFEDSLNSHGTVYIFGKMPVKQKSDESVVKINLLVCFFKSKYC